jgi:hypothetical protein
MERRRQPPSLTAEALDQMRKVLASYDEQWQRLNA